MARPTSTPKHFCAICGDDIVGPPHREPLGKDDALVDVCDACATEVPREARGPDRGYQVREAASPSTAVAARGAAEHPRPRGASRRLYYQARAARPTPGFVVVRVARVALGESIDLEAARQTLRDQPWFDELRVLGSTAKWHLFERPNQELAAKSRDQLNGADPLAALEKWKST